MLRSTTDKSFDKQNIIHCHISAFCKMDDEIVLGSSLSKEILKKYPKAVIQERIGNIHEILAQDIESSINPGYTKFTCK